MRALFCCDLKLIVSLTLFALWLEGLAASTAHAQVIPQGITQWSTQITAGPVSVDMATGNMVVRLRIRDKAGAIPFAFDLVDNMNNQGAINSNNSFLHYMSSGGMTGFKFAPSSLCGQPLNTTIKFGNFSPNQWSLTDGSGASHPFTFPPIRIGPSTCGGVVGPLTAVASDGSGYTAVVTGSSSSSGHLGWVIYNKDGMSYSGGPLTDANGNTISFAYNSGVTTWTDTLGQPSINMIYGGNLQTGGHSGNPDQYYYTDFNGANQYYTVSYASLPVKTLFSCGAPYGDMDTTMYLPSAITTPTGAQYVFTYEPTPGYAGDVTGRLSNVALPSGGSVSFAYSGGVNGFNCTSRVIPSLQISTNDNSGHSSTTTYANNNTGVSSFGPYDFTVTETDSLGDVTTHYFYGEQETERIVSDVNLGVLSTTITCYNGNFTNCPTPATQFNNIALLNITQTDVYTQIGSSPWSLVETTFDKGSPISGSRYDWGATFPPSGQPTAKTTTAYDTSGACGALAIAYMYNRPCSVATVDSSGSQISQTNYTYNSTGHPIQTSRWIGGTTYATSSASYNANGTIATSTDAKGATTTFNYDGSCNGLVSTSTQYPTVNGITPTTLQTWNCSGGVLTSSTDFNGKQTTYSYVNPATSLPDPLWRRTKVTYPDGGSTTTTYSTGTSLPWSIATSTAITGSTNLIDTTIYDGLGRTIQTQLNSDPQGVDNVDTTYDALGRVSTVTNPHRSGSSSTDGTTTYHYDALGRTTSVTLQDGSVTTTSYSGNCTTVTDPTAKSRKSCSDGLGRLTQVFEDPSGLNYETDYGYDALDNLLCVGQKGTNTGTFSGCASIPASWRPRTFSYDSLSRLTSATNPESGTITYSYDANGNLLTKTAPAPNQTGTATVTTCFGNWNGTSCNGSGYDALNRVTRKTYSDGTAPTATFTYDISSLRGVTIQNPIGRLVTADTSWASGSTYIMRSYDPMGRVATQWQWFPARAAQVTYAFRVDVQYNLAGLPSAFSNESNWFYLQYDAAGRVTTLTTSLNDSQHPGTLVTVDPTVGYYPSGALRKAALGNGLTLTNVYNNRLQPCLLDVNNANVTLQTCNDSTPSGNILDLWMGYTTGSSNNWNIVNWNATGAQSFVRTYSYDSLNRIATMADSNTGQACRGLSWTVDPWGNRTDQTVTAGTCGTFHQSVDANNRLLGAPYQYDAAGNMTNDASHSYTYDAENRLTQVDGGATATYIYDAEGHRVQKSTGGVTTAYVQDIVTGQVIEETNGSDTMQVGYVYLNGGMIAQYKNGTTYFVHKDHLGSTRLLTDLNQFVVDNLDYLPFGEQISGDTATTHKFTGKERDSESGLDNFSARYDSSSMGRFMSPDPVVITTERLYDPQQLNGYSYVRNNPLRFLDPTGMILQLSGDLAADKDELCRIAGDACDRISVNEKTGVVTFNTEGLDLSTNAGAALVNDLVQSKSTFDFSISETVDTAGGTIKIDHIANLDNNPDDRYNYRKPPGKVDKEKPKPGVDDQVAINPNAHTESENSLKKATRESVAFHELAEAYAKVEHSKQYEAAHQEAIQREQKLRDQRPYLKEHNPGSGPGDKLIIKR